MIATLFALALYALGAYHFYTLLPMIQKQLYDMDFKNFGTYSKAKVVLLWPAMVMLELYHNLKGTPGRE